SVVARLAPVSSREMSVPGSAPETAATGQRETAARAGSDSSRWWFALGLAFYLATRLLHLNDFPGFFFCDEAIQANTAYDLYHHHFRDAQGVLLPSYFANDERRAMSLNIYLLVAPIVLLGKSIVVTRGTFAVLSALGAAAVGIALRVTGVGLWWAAP